MFFFPRFSCLIFQLCQHKYLSATTYSKFTEISFPPTKFMAKIQTIKVPKSSSPLIFLLHVLSVGLTCAAYALPDKYFINCGSDTNMNPGNPTFSGDLSSDSISFSKQNYPV
ncbi:hypothetical protein CICLE_v10027620mg [Citrus x clementina]|uniref:Malectin-like domain-containing protein n=1 Tax=Citrus clementina TaxID=85681 RepID=V4SK83_CITCL|nr:hypothetical protein CICLE_v10027620mg [Citrus x clementina]